MERLKAASESWQAALDERISKHPLPARPSPATTRPNNLAPASTDEDCHAILKTPSADFLAAEAIWRHLPPRQLWSQFQAIAWGLHGEVDRLAFHGALGGRDDIVYMLFQGSDFAGGDAGALCTGVHEDGTVARPFAVIGISQELHTQYLTLKESLLHEIAHWAAHRAHGPWQALGPSEVSTSGHGDYWQAAVRQIQAVFGDFVGFRCLEAASVPRGGRGGGGHVDLGVFTHAFACAACGTRQRYASSRRDAGRRCPACGTPALAYIGQYDTDGQAYPRQRNAAWHALVAARIEAAYASAAQRHSTPQTALAQALDDLAREAALQRAAPAAAGTPTATASAPDTTAATLGGRGSGGDSAHAGSGAPAAHTARAARHVATAQSREHECEAARKVDASLASEDVGMMHALEGLPHAPAPPKSLASEASAAASVRGTAGDAAVVGAAVPPRPRGARAAGRAHAPRQLLGQGATAGLWGEYVRAAWPAAHAAATKRNRLRKHPLGPRPLCRQVMRTIAKWWRADKPRFQAAAGLRGEAPEGPATAVRAMQCMWSRFGDRPWGRLRRNDDIRRLVALWP